MYRYWNLSSGLSEYISLKCLFSFSFLQQQLCTILFYLTSFFNLSAATVMDRWSILFLYNCSTNFATSASLKELWVGQSEARRRNCANFENLFCVFIFGRVFRGKAEKFRRMFDVIKSSAKCAIRLMPEPFSQLRKRNHPFETLIWRRFS